MSGLDCSFLWDTRRARTASWHAQCVTQRNGKENGVEWWCKTNSVGGNRSDFADPYFRDIIIAGFLLDMGEYTAADGKETMWRGTVWNFVGSCVGVCTHARARVSVHAEKKRLQALCCFWSCRPLSLAYRLRTLRSNFCCINDHLLKPFPTSLPPSPSVFTARFLNQCSMTDHQKKIFPMLFSQNRNPLNLSHAIYPKP